MNSSSQVHAASLPTPVPDDALALDEPGEHQVAVLSAAVLQAVMNTYGDDYEALAVRVGVAAGIVAEAIGGTRPAWALPYEEFMALADLVAALWPCEVFETAAACDLLLSCILNGDQFIAADVLTDPCSQNLARTLLRLAVASEPGSNLLPGDLLAFLRERAAALADSRSPDAWIGVEILLTCLGRQS